MDDSNEPSTLVQFEIEEVGDGARLTVTESDFDQLPAARRDQAFDPTRTAGKNRWGWCAISWKGTERRPRAEGWLAPSARTGNVGNVKDPARLSKPGDEF